MNWRKKFRKTEEITQIHQKEVMEMAIRKLLQMQETDFYRDRKFNLVFRQNKYINVLGDYAEK
jgi:hypothetical protein